MNADKKNISRIEDYFFYLLEGMENVYFGTLPTPKSEWETMVLVDCANAISDFDAFGNGTVLVYLYAKPNGEIKNSAALNKLEEQLNERLKTYKSPHGYSSSIQWKEADYDETKRLHCVVVALNILIV